MNFEWDQYKNRINITKHGIDFSDIYRVFEGPMVARIDEREEYGELRWIGTGYLINNVVVVVYLEIDDDAIRVISARKALKHERKEFEQELKNRLG